MKYVRNNKYGDPVHFILGDDLIIKGNKGIFTGNPDGNSWFYSSIHINGLFAVKNNSVITISNKDNVRFKINSIKEDIEARDGDNIAFVLTGRLLK